MRIAFCYPPFSKGERFPNLPQNRQFIYSSSREVKLYPVVMATAATWLRNSAHQILWLDGITTRMSWKVFEETLFSFNPGIVVLEAKAPIMKRLWKLIDKWKVESGKWKIVLVGDHVTYFPEESFKTSKVDFILTGGDYDFLLVSLVRHLEEGRRLRPGIFFRDKGKINNTGKLRLDHDLDEAPIIDRKLTRWQDYGEAYLYRPCAYVMFGRGCGIKGKERGACTFCIWQHALWQCSARLVSPQQAVAEVQNLVNLGVKEIFDDTESGVLWDYEWLRKFYQLLERERLLGKVIFSSNARGDQLDKNTCRLLKQLGYRLLKVGLESGSNEILAQIGKKEKIEDIIHGVKNAKDAGLRVMLTVMVGYPWGKEEEVRQTYAITRELMLYKTRAGDCLQASVIIPYPGTPLWLQAKRNGWLIVEPYDYEKFDMGQPVLKTKIDAQQWCNRIWSIQKDPQFVLKSGLTIRSINETVLLLRGAKSLLGHIRDYMRTGER